MIKYDRHRSEFLIKKDKKISINFHIGMDLIDSLFLFGKQLKKHFNGFNHIFILHFLIKIISRLNNFNLINSKL